MSPVEKDLEGRLSVRIGSIVIKGRVSLTEYENGLSILELAGGTQKYVCEQRIDGGHDILEPYSGE